MGILVGTNRTLIGLLRRWFLVLVAIGAAITGWMLGDLLANPHEREARRLRDQVLAHARTDPAAALERYGTLRTLVVGHPRERALPAYLLSAARMLLTCSLPPGWSDLLTSDLERYAP